MALSRLLSYPISAIFKMDFNNSKGVLYFFFNFNITIFQKTHFSPKKGPCGKIHTRQNICWHVLFCGPCGKIHTRQNMCWHFSRKKKAPAGKFTHGKICVGIFLEKKAPAGKFTHGKILWHFLAKKGPCGKMHTRHKNVLRICFDFSGRKILCITNFHT